MLAIVITLFIVSATGSLCLLITFLQFPWPHSLPPVTSSLIYFPVSLGLFFIFFGSMCKWNCTVFVLLCLTYLASIMPSSFIHVFTSGRISSLYIYYVVHYISEKAMATHSSTLAWKIPWTEEPGRLQSMGSLRVGHDWATSLSLFTFRHWRRKWQPTPVFLPGESQGRGSPMGCRLWGPTESDTTEAT